MNFAQLILNLPLHPEALPKFRGAVAEQAGMHNELFHNHDNAKGGLHYRYPLVQYHTVDGMAAIVGIAEGAEALTQWKEAYQGHIDMAGKSFAAPVLAHTVEDIAVQTTEAWHTYELRDWVALNEKHYKEWRACQRMADRMLMLEKAFTAQVMAFARGINWYVDQRLQAQLLDLSEPQWRKRSGADLLVFDARLSIQATLPSGIGIGKGASLGFGRMHSAKG